MLAYFECISALGGGDASPVLAVSCPQGTLAFLLLGTADGDRFVAGPGLVIMRASGWGQICGGAGHCYY